MNKIDYNNWYKRWITALNEQHQLFFDYNEHTLKDEYASYTDCPVCKAKSSEASLEFMKDMFYYYRCAKCSLIFMNPRMNDAATASFYNSNVNAIYNETKFDSDSDQPNADDFINENNFNLLNANYHNKANGNLLEIGCAKGFFLSKAKAVGYKVWGLELNAKNYAFAERYLGNNIINKDLLDVRFDREMFDVIYMRDVIEHLPYPIETFKEINRILNNTGILFIETHNIEGLIHLIAREKHTVIFGFEHPVHYSPKSIKYLFNITGFKIDSIVFESRDFSIKGILSYFSEPTFTTIMPEKVPDIQILLVKFLSKAFNCFPLNYIDSLFPIIANKLKRGSTMKVFASKMDMHH